MDNISTEQKYWPARKIESNIGYGNRSGWLDPNNTLYPTDLVGYRTNPGSYFKMRYSHHTISSIMDSRKNFLRSIEFVFDGPYADQLNSYWMNKVKTIDGIPYSLSDFIADTSDAKESFGFSLYEYHKDNLGIYLYPINPLQVKQFIGTNTLEAAQIDNISSIITLYSENLLLLSNQIYAGNWWGVSGLRSLLDLYLVYEQEIKNFLQSRPLEKGIVYGKQTDVSDSASYDGILDILEAYQRGQSVSGVLDTGFSLDILQVNNGQDSVAQLKETMNSTDEKIRATLWSNLESLGISTHGSRALGETLIVNDQKKLEQYIEAQLEALKSCKLFIDMADDLGIPVSEIEITTPGVTRSDSRLNFERLWELLEKGILSKDEIGQQNWTQLLESLGLETRPNALGGSVTLSEPLPVVIPEYVLRNYKRGLRKLTELNLEALADPADVAMYKSIVETGEATPEYIELGYNWWRNNKDFLSYDQDTKESVWCDLWGGYTGKLFFEREYNKMTQE